MEDSTKTTKKKESSAIDMFRKLLDLAKDATLSCVSCLCETSGGTTTAGILQCQDCGYSVCRDCASSASLDLDVHRMKDMKCSRVGAGVFEAKLRCLTPPKLRLTSGASSVHKDLKDIVFALKTVSREHGKWKVLYVAKDKFGRAVADMELYLGKIAMGQKQETGILVLLRHFKKERCNILPPNARLVMTAATKEPVWEVLDTSADSQKITLSDEKPSKNTPSYRAQMGVVRFMKADQDLLVDKEQTVNFRNERWPDEIRVKSPSGSTTIDGVYRRTKCMGTVCFHALWRCVRGISHSQ